MANWKTSDTHGEHHGVQQRRPERRVVEDRAVVVQPDERRVALDERAHGVVAQAQVEVAVERVGVERDQVDRPPGRGSAQAAHCVPARGAAGRPAAARRPPPRSAVARPRRSARSVVRDRAVMASLGRRGGGGLGGGQRVLRRLRPAQRGLHRGPQRLGDLRVLGAEVVAGAALGGLDRRRPRPSARGSPRPAWPAPPSVGRDVGQRGVGGAASCRRWSGRSTSFCVVA